MKIIKLLTFAVLFMTLKIYTNLAQSDGGVDFSEIQWDDIFSLDVHWGSDGIPVYVIAPYRQTNDIFILDNNLNVLNRFDPDIDSYPVDYHTIPTSEVIWSSDGRSLAVIREGLFERYLQVWDVQNQTPQTIAKGLFLGKMAWQPNGNLLAVVEQRSIIVFDMSLGTLIYTTDVVSATSLDWSSDGMYLYATQGIDGSAKVWNGLSGQEVFSLKHGNSAKRYNQLSASPASNEISIYTQADETIEIWDILSQTKLRTLQLNKSATEGVKWLTPSIIAIYNKNPIYIQLWNPITGSLIQEISLQNKGRVEFVDWNFLKNTLFYVMRSSHLINRLQDQFVETEIIPFMPTATSSNTATPTGTP
jgi:WD40 repeat protein